jgi:hypothetical protein
LNTEDPTTQEHRIRQSRRAEEEREQADEAPTEDGTEQHEARAAKAEYLRAKLEERADAERRKDAGDEG